MFHRATLALSLAVVAPLGVSPAAHAAGPAPDPRPAPGFSVEANARVLGMPGAVRGRTRPTNAMTMTQYRTQKVRWSAKTCTKATLAASAEARKAGVAAAVECATIKTPLSWTDLSKGSMDLHISRVRAVHPKGKPAPKAEARLLFVNSGGPGGVTGPMAVSVAASSPSLRPTHDIVGVDPRGTGGSTPLSCPPAALGVADSRNLSPEVRAEAQANLEKFVQGCVKKHGAYLPHITTANTVSDHDLVRQILAGPSVKADWYGISAGTWMGAWYTHLYPKSLDRVVLDANTEFTTDWRSSFTILPMGFERRFRGQFLPWMARQHKTYKGGRTTAETLDSYERVRAAAGKGKVTGIRPDDVDALLMSFMYSDASFPVAARFISGTDALLRKNGKAVPALPKSLLEGSTEGDASSLTVRTAIICNDTPHERTPESYEREFRSNITKFPLTAGAHHMVLAPCGHWPYRPAPAPEIDGRRGPMKLMVQTEFDAATPIEGARRAHAASANTRMLTVKGQGSHGGYLNGNRCADATVDRYLTKGVLPKRDTVCAGTPLPGEKKLHPVTWRP